MYTNLPYHKNPEPSFRGTYTRSTFITISSRQNHSILVTTAARSTALHRNDTRQTRRMLDVFCRAVMCVSLWRWAMLTCGDTNTYVLCCMLICLSPGELFDRWVGNFLAIYEGEGGWTEAW
jgi:hypothetical protein